MSAYGYADDAGLLRRNQKHKESTVNEKIKL